jgi:hypothetical protein
MSTADVLQRILGRALASAAGSLADDTTALATLETLGWSLATPPPALAPVAAIGASLATLVDQLADRAPTPAQAAAMTGAIEASWTALETLASEPPPSELIGTAFSELARDLVDGWLLDAIDAEAGAAVPLLSLLGVVEIRECAADGVRGAHTMRRIHWDRAVAALTDPVQPFRTTHRWGTPDFDAPAVLASLASLLTAGRAHVVLREPEEGAPGVPPDPAGQLRHTVDYVVVERQSPGGDVEAVLRVRPWHEPPGLPGLALEPIVSGALGVQFAVDDHARVELVLAASLAAGMIAVVDPDQGLWMRGRDLPGAIEGRASARIVVDDPARPRRTLLAAPGVSATAATLQGTVWVEHLGSTTDLGVEAWTEDARFAIDTDSLPGVLRRMLGARRWETGGAIGVGWSRQRGLYFRGGALVVQVPFTVNAGPVTLRGLDVAVDAVDGLRLRVGATGRIGLGPVAVEWTGLGAYVALRPPGTTQPRTSFAIGVDVPSRVGLAIDAGPVRGGGSLEFVSGDDRCVGGLALDVLGLAVAAHGVLDARGQGYSLAAVIAAEFRAIPLPLGFTLDGVGGLIAIHRRVDTDALRACLRTPAGMGDIFFPADPVAQAERVTTDLATYFPAAEGRHVFGPAVKFGWGTPTMIRGELAVLLELPAPARVVLLGTVSAKLPTVDHAIVDLNVDVLGEVDFAQKRVAIDASLRNSTIAGFPITGDMAFRMAWGSPPSFALAIGGFHSQFPKPPGFPELRRVQIPLGAGDDPRLDAQGFLALTSNTAQIGAQIDLYASAGPLNIKGWLGFETLLTFSPFQLQVDVWAGVALRRGTSTLASIHFDGHLSGPKPWRLDGKACLSLWFVDLCVPIHVSFGAGTAAVLPSRQIWPALHEALATPAAWASAVPPGLAAAVTAPASGEAPAPRLEPCATLTVTQKVVPLDRQITAFAHGRPDGVERFQVTGVRFGAAAVPAHEIAPVTEWFAPAQFEEMSDADKLSRPGFEQMVGGVAIGAATIRAGSPLVRALDYDTVVIVDGQRQEPPRYRPTRDLQLEGTLAAASARPPLRATGPAAFAPPPGRPPRLRLVEETFVIASTDALAPRWDLAAAGTRGQVELALRAHLAAHPGDAERLQVVPTFEVAA